MFRAPSITELLLIAAIGARGWFITLVLVGLALLAASVVLNPTVEPKAVVFAFFMPLIISALMGTVALGAHRARGEVWGAGSLRKQAFAAAFVWNCILGTAALVLDRVVCHFKLLPRDPFEFPQSMAVVVAMAAMLALMAVYPRQGPQ